MPWRRFLAFNALGAALWVGVRVTLGDLAGDHIGTLCPAIQRYESYSLAAVGIVLATVVIRHLHRRGTHASPVPDRPRGPGHPRLLTTAPRLSWGAQE